MTIESQMYRQLLNTLGVNSQEEAMAEIGRLHGCSLRVEAAEARVAKILAEWEPTYRAYHGAFDTPLARRRDGSEFAEDARARMHEFHDLLTGAFNAQGESNGK